MIKNAQLPDLIYDHVNLDVHLDPQDGLEHIQNHKIWITLEELGYTHMYCPVITRIEDKLSC